MGGRRFARGGSWRAFDSPQRSCGGVGVMNPPLPLFGFSGWEEGGGSQLHLGKVYRAPRPRRKELSPFHLIPASVAPAPLFNVWFVSSSSLSPVFLLEFEAPPPAPLRPSSTRIPLLLSPTDHPSQSPPLSLQQVLLISLPGIHSNSPPLAPPSTPSIAPSAARPGCRPSLVALHCLSPFSAPMIGYPHACRL